jgi:hypothetical protein
VLCPESVCYNLVEQERKEHTDMKMVAEQMELSRELPVVRGNVDYQEFVGRLVEVDGLLRETGVEEEFVEKQLTQWEGRLREKAGKKGKAYREPGSKSVVRMQKIFRMALRCNMARLLTEKEYRRFTRWLAHSAVLQSFCGIVRVEVIRVPGKSTLERYDKLAMEGEVRELVNRLNRKAVEGQVGMEKELDLEAYFSDGTCVKAAIHFPVDWVLLRDSVRTLMKAILVIRRHGLKHRMPEPEMFLRNMNRLSIEMTQTRRKEDSERKRKKVLRRMKRLNQIVMKHARRYREKLAETWEKETDLKEGEVRRILKRVDGVLEQMPSAIRQAHERIIGGRQVKNAEKILSLYEREIHVIVRGKAGAEVEFGNTLWLGEQAEGLIIDWKLCRDRNPGDTKLFRESMERIHGVFGWYPKSAAGDRGLWSQDNEEWLEGSGVYSALCPRGVEELRERMKEKAFAQLQKRRGQTEARIGIMKNDFLGRPLRSKGFEHREVAVAWAVLGHNLWLLAGLRYAEQKEKRKAA